MANTNGLQYLSFGLLALGCRDLIAQLPALRLKSAGHKQKLDAAFMSIHEFNA
jgi:hypothetical protein